MGQPFPPGLVDHVLLGFVGCHFCLKRRELEFENIDRTIFLIEFFPVSLLQLEKAPRVVEEVIARLVLKHGWVNLLREENTCQRPQSREKHMLATSVIRPLAVEP
jgi:hypothetical protein